ncbi:MAG: universal stress protein [Candidatus Promineifilaceae bacterium]
MGVIVCAMRGGPGSRAVQRRAVELAAQAGKRLIFLYVVDVASVPGAEGKLGQAARAELTWLGQTLLAIAVHRADNKGVPAQAALREGDPRHEISRFLAENAAELLLLGAPRRATGAFGAHDSIEAFAQAIQDESGLPVEIVRPDGAAGAAQ